jgi:hypothetical protein
MCRLRGVASSPCSAIHGASGDATVLNRNRKRPKKPAKPKKKMRTAGTHCVWPSGIEQRYGIKAVTRWRWERDRKLPMRDVFVDGVAVGWRPETLEAAERGSAAQRSCQPEAARAA